MADKKLGRYPFCGAPFPGWQECPLRRKCLAGKVEYCRYPERSLEYEVEKHIYGRW